MLQSEIQTRHRIPSSMILRRRRDRLPPSPPQHVGGREADIRQADPLRTSDVSVIDGTFRVAGVSLSSFAEENKFKLKPFIVFCLLVSLFFSSVSGGVPRFFESNRMAVLLLPGDTEVDSIIYRLRAEDTDRNYPLLFQIKGFVGTNLIYIDSHDCTPSSDIFCEADVYLRQVLEVGRLYIFNLTVSDTRGYMTEVSARIDATNGRLTPTSQIFVKYSPTVEVREDMPPKTVISTMTVRKKPRSTFGEFQILGPANKIFRMQSANLVSTDSINGTLVLEKKVDYEQANLHTFKVCILQPYTDELVDTRNIACVLVSVVVDDVQDEPPIFVKAPPVTRVPANAVAGDSIVQIEAKDGDRGIPREIRYSILPETSLYAKYFKMDGKTGMIAMNATAVSLRDNMISLDPILMTVTADEVTSRPESYPALSSSVEIAFVILESELLVPKFVHENYIGEIYEDSIPDTPVTFSSPFLVKDVKGLFSLELQGDKGAFSVSPSLVKDASDITIKVKNSFLLDYEKAPQMSFKLIARQVRGLQQASSSTEVTIRVMDVNDNPPKFSQAQYEVDIYENITRGTSILRVYATDEDSGPFGVIRYTHIEGPAADKLFLDPVSGVITCATDNHNFDRETSAEYILTVEAMDNNGRGTSANTATAKIVIRVKDVNDNPPKFEESIYKGVMSPDRQALRDPIRVRATDADSERPNNEIIYSLERSSYSDFFSIDRRSGYLDINQNYLPRIAGLNSAGKPRTKRQLSNDTVISLRVRATDLGDPPLSDYVDVKIFKQEYGERVIKFIYPKPASEVRVYKRDLESTLNALTGGSTTITEVKSLFRGGYLVGEIDPFKSEVTALVRFGLDTVIDVEQLMSRLNNSEVQKLQSLTQERQVVITKLEDKNNSYVIGVAFLCIILIIVLIIIGLCCICEGCPLFRHSKSSMMDDGDGVNYVRVDENGKYRSHPDDPDWWLSMPYFMKELFLFCGYTPPGKNRSRLAWSGDERQRYGRINQPADLNMVEDRGGMVQVMPQHRQREPLAMEDLDAARMNRQAYGRQPVRVDSRNSQFSQEPRRVFVLKDALGIPRGEEGLREGNTYLLEDVEEDPNMPRGNDGRYRNNGGYADEELLYQQGNDQLLRQHASLQDAALYNETQRRFRQADMESEEPGMIPDPTGRGYVQRYVNGQPTGPSNARYGQNYINGDDRYGHNGSPSSLTEGPSNQYKGRGRHEDSTNLTEVDINRSLRDKNRNKNRTQQQVAEVHRTMDKSTEPIDLNRSNIGAKATLQGPYGSRHTKTSILRHESIKAKIEEEKEERIREGKDPDYCITHQGLGGGGGSISGSRKGSVRDSKRSHKKETNVRSHPQYPMPGDSRRSSLPEIETNLEREAAMRHIRKNSGGAADYRDEPPYPANSSRDVEYEADPEKSEEIERRRQQRRSQASEALSEDLRPKLEDQSAMALLQQQQLQLLQQQQQLLQQQLMSQQMSLNHQTLTQLDGGLLSPRPPAFDSLTTVSEGQLAVPSRKTSEEMAAEASTGDATEGGSGDPGQKQEATKGVTKEAIQNAIAAAAVASIDEGNRHNEKINNNANINGSLVNVQQAVPKETNNDNINKSDLTAMKTMQDKSITNDLNLPDDVKSLKAEEQAQATLQKSQSELSLRINPSTIIEKNVKDDSSILNIPRDKRKRNRMLEKKSVFTIAYDGVKTDQLRPDSAAGLP